MTSCQQFIISWLFFQYMPNLEPPRSLIWDTWSIILNFPIIKTFHLIKGEDRTTISLKHPRIIALKEGNIFV